MPLHKVMQATHLCNQLISWALRQMVRICQNNFGAKVTNGIGHQTFNGCLSTNRHKNRRWNITMRRMEDAGACVRLRIFGEKFVGKPRIFFFLCPIFCVYAGNVGGKTLCFFGAVWHVTSITTCGEHQPKLSCPLFSGPSFLSHVQDIPLPRRLLERPQLPQHLLQQQRPLQHECPR